QGHVLVNGDDFYRNFAAYRTVLGYVPQDDILHRQLSVQRALEYAARLRLPVDTSDQEVATRIERVLDDVEMTPHRDKPIETLSGGQRKRVSIGAELLADPSLFFLDEPTSGLDPGLEKKMMYTLRRLADSGRIVVLVTHATANIMQCDHVIFMAGNGRMVFFGPPAEALQFFQITSGDFADIYTKIEGIAAPDHSVVRRDLKTEYDMWCALHPQADSPPTLAELWEIRYRQSSLYQRYVVARLAAAPSGPQVQNPTVKQAPQRVSALRQFGLLTRRYFDLMRQDRRNVLILLLQAPIIALLLVLVVRSDALTGTQAQDLIQRSEAKKLLFMLATVSVWFGIINAAREITKEQAIYRRERLV
ncbi:MAG: ATP-binding cassette domain-containing protein, partial [Chloroflexi bacterium]